MNNSLWFLDRYESIGKDINKHLSDIFLFYTFGLSILGGMIFGVAGLISVTEFINTIFPGGIGTFWEAIITFFSIGFFLFCSAYIMYNLMKILTIVPLNSLIRSTVHEIQGLHTLIEENIESYENIEVILTKSLSVFKLQKNLGFIGKVIKRIDKKYYSIFKSIVNESIHWSILKLHNLRSDLSLRLTEHRSTLEQAKSEVSTHIHGSEALNQVSELQKQRLDRQIEQFEELQRVLMKV